MTSVKYDDESPGRQVANLAGSSLLEFSTKLDVHAALYDAGLTAFSSLLFGLNCPKRKSGGVLEFVERVTAHTVNQSALPAPFCLSEMLGFFLTSIPFYTSSLTNSHRTKEAVSLRLPSKAPQPLLLPSTTGQKQGPARWGLYFGEYQRSRGAEGAVFKIRIFGTQSLPASPSLRTGSSFVDGLLAQLFASAADCSRGQRCQFWWLSYYICSSGRMSKDVLSNWTSRGVVWRDWVLRLGTSDGHSWCTMYVSIHRIDSV
jgi:hypothetical protein